MHRGNDSDGTNKRGGIKTKRNDTWSATASSGGGRCAIRDRSGRNSGRHHHRRAGATHALDGARKTLRRSDGHGRHAAAGGLADAGTYQ
jgi:hypothetical protein